jgi:hypothetical protein
MECAAWPCRQGTVSCSTWVEEPKYPRAMSALVEGNSLPEPQRSQNGDRPSRGSRHAWQSSRCDGRSVAPWKH